MGCIDTPMPRSGTHVATKMGSRNGLCATKIPSSRKRLESRKVTTWVAQSRNTSGAKSQHESLKVAKRVARIIKCNIDQKTHFTLMKMLKKQPILFDAAQTYHKNC